MSPAQINANRANAQLSTGPVTPEGKRRSSLNATKHSLTGKIHIATPEEGAAFEHHCRTLREAYAPVGVLETNLAQDLAEDHWRLMRIRNVENNLFALAAAGAVEKSAAESSAAERPQSGDPDVDAGLSQAQAWVEHDRSFRLLGVYENRLRRAVEKGAARLEAMQKERKQAYAQAQQEAIALFQLAKSEGRAYDPAADFQPAENHGGFVFSAAAIAQQIDRAQRLRQNTWPALMHPSQKDLGRLENTCGPGAIPATPPD